MLRKRPATVATNDFRSVLCASDSEAAAPELAENCCVYTHCSSLRKAKPPADPTRTSVCAHARDCPCACEREVARRTIERDLCATAEPRPSQSGSALSTCINSRHLRLHRLPVVCLFVIVGHILESLGSIGGANESQKRREQQAAGAAAGGGVGSVGPLDRD